MADAAEAELAAARSLSLADRVAHKNWKVRAEAYGAIADKLGSVFSSDDPIVSEAGASRAWGGTGGEGRSTGHGWGTRPGQVGNGSWEREGGVGGGRIG